MSVFPRGNPKSESNPAAFDKVVTRDSCHEIPATIALSPPIFPADNLQFTRVRFVDSLSPKGRKHGTNSSQLSPAIQEEGLLGH
jgi:hypothetical protein